MILGRYDKLFDLVVVTALLIYQFILRYWKSGRNVFNAVGVKCHLKTTLGAEIELLNACSDHERIKEQLNSKRSCFWYNKLKLFTVESIFPTLLARNIFYVTHLTNNWTSVRNYPFLIQRTCMWSCCSTFGAFSRKPYGNFSETMRPRSDCWTFSQEVIVILSSARSFGILMYLQSICVVTNKPVTIMSYKGHIDLATQQ